MTQIKNYFNTSYVTVQRISSAMFDMGKKISIHPMLRFNDRCDGIITLCHKISIHPMLRFNSYTYFGLDLIATFQYILCYGSTCSYLRKIRFHRYISIHPMLRFNPCVRPDLSWCNRISIHPMLRFNLVFRYC